MRSTLFYIPYEFAGLPMTGAGWLLIVWILLGIGVTAERVLKHGWSQETLGYLPLFAIGGLVIYLFLPNMVEFATQPDGSQVPLGIPVKGFGVMMMLAMIGSVGLAMHRAWQLGVDPEVMSSLAMWMIIPGVIGARLFFVIQYHDQFVHPTLWATLVSLLNVSKGGLVVYGSVLAGVPFGIYYLARRGLPVLAMLDIIAPSMVVGLAIGRIGCFLNGCCYGGQCDWPVAVTFPPSSPPFERQHELGLLYGIKLNFDPQTLSTTIGEVLPGSAADRAGLPVGEQITHINGKEVPKPADVIGAFADAGPVVEVTLASGKTVILRRDPWPGRSLPIHASQLYAALDAALLALFLWCYFPYRRRDGEVFALLVTIHPVSRILLEMIRSDEPGQFGTSLTISQWLSLGILVAAAGFWIYLERAPRKLALPLVGES